MWRYLEKYSDVSTQWLVFRGKGYNRHVGRALATTTYHALHHGRYVRNYGLGTRFLDRALNTEWEDYEPLYDRVVGRREPLMKLREQLEASP